MRSPTASLRRTRKPERAVEAGLRVLEAESQREAVGLDQLLLALEAFGDQRLEHLEFDVEQRRERADIDHVAVELALARLGYWAAQISVSGMPMTAMSPRVMVGGRGRVES